MILNDNYLPNVIDLIKDTLLGLKLFTTYIIRDATRSILLVFINLYRFNKATFRFDGLLSVIVYEILSGYLNNSILYICVPLDGDGGKYEIIDGPYLLLY